MSVDVDTAPVAVSAEQGADWTRYAESYDLLLDHNPAYQDLIDRFARFVDHVSPLRSVLDVGGGTGNFSGTLLDRHRDVALTFLEPDPGMRSQAASKLGSGTAMVAQSFEAFETDRQFDLILCTHALYAMPDPMARLRQMRSMIRPDGQLFIIDFGRPMRVWDWRLYLARKVLQQKGLAETLRIVRETREAARQNGEVSSAQRSGRYWCHSTAEFAEALQESGWRIRRLDRVYRGYSDLALCTPSNAMTA